MMEKMGTIDPAGPGAEWGEQIPGEEWEVYRSVIAGMREAGIGFALGGAFALATYTGELRNTKDLDLYILPESREGTVEVMERAGLSDYFDVLPYDRAWIYRAHAGATIVDSIWAMANARARVDHHWIFDGPTVSVKGESLRVVPVEEMIWAKLYVMQRSRCDWPDIINMLYAAGRTLGWEHLIDRVGRDLPLLAGVVSTFAWLSPGRSAAFPSWIWERLGLALPEEGPEHDPQRVNFFDTRPWFAPMMRKH